MLLARAMALVQAQGLVLRVMVQAQALVRAMVPLVALVLVQALVQL